MAYKHKQRQQLKLFHLFADPILNLLDLFVKLENILRLLEAFAALTRCLEQFVPLHYQTVDTLLYLRRCLVMFL